MSDDSDFDFENDNSIGMDGGSDASIFSLPTGSALASTSVDPSTGGIQSGSNDGSTALGFLSSMFGGGTPTLGDNTSGGPTGSGALSLTNGGGSTGNVVGTSGYSLPSDAVGIVKDVATPSGGKSILQQLASTVEDKNGNLDLSKLVKIGTGLAGAYSAYQKNKQAAASQAANTSAAQTAAAQQTWTPAQAASAANYFGGTQNRTLVNPSANGISSIVPASVTRPQVGYAEGGPVKGSSEANALAQNPIFAHILASILTGAGSPASVAKPDNGQGLVPLAVQARTVPLLAYDGGEDEHDLNGNGNGMADGGGVVASNPDMGALAATAPGGALSHGTYGLVSGPGDGQSDSIPINAAAGEYMVDAESVSMLGNGDNDAGAQVLDQWREALRQHKRSAPPDQIAPPTGPDQMPPTGAQ